MAKKHKLSLFKILQAQFSVGQGAILKPALDYLVNNNISSIYPLVEKMNSKSQEIFLSFLLEHFSNSKEHISLRRNTDSCLLLCHMLKKVDLYRKLSEMDVFKSKNVIVPILSLFPDEHSENLGEILPIYQNIMVILEEQNKKYFARLEDSGELRVHANGLGLNGTDIFNMEKVAFLDLKRKCDNADVPYLDHQKSIMNNFQSWLDLCKTATRNQEEKITLLTLVETDTKFNKKKALL